MRKLRSTRKHREEIKKQRAIENELRENGMSEVDIVNYKHMMSVSKVLETAANAAVAKKLQSLGVESQEEKVEEVTTVNKEEVEATNV